MIHHKVLREIKEEFAEFEEARACIQCDVRRAKETCGSSEAAVLKIASAEEQYPRATLEEPAHIPQVIKPLSPRVKRTAAAQWSLY
jgi:hypothetical protein